MLGADSEAGLARLAGLPLELGVRALAHAALAHTPAIADLPVGGHARRSVQRAVTGAAGVVGEALAHTTPAHSIACDERTRSQDNAKAQPQPWLKTQNPP